MKVPEGMISELGQYIVNEIENEAWRRFRIDTNEDPAWEALIEKVQEAFDGLLTKPKS